MRPVTAWAHMMRQSVTIEAVSTGMNAYGERTPGTSTTYRCRLVAKRQLVRNSQGKEVMSRAVLYLMSDAAIDPQSKVTLSTGDVGSMQGFDVNPPIASVARYSDDGGGFHNTVLYLE